MKTEYTSQPQPFEILPLPTGKVQIILRENITSELRDIADYRDEAEFESDVETEPALIEVWSADEYTIIKRPRHGLEDDIAANTGKYIAEAKAKDAENRAREAARQYEAEINGSIVDTLLDYDFRLMMLEETGGDINGIQAD